MFNSIVYIPTILAYTFVALLVVILGFIVIYVSHKIYASIYDNLPVAQLSSSSSITKNLKSMAQSSAIVSGLAATRRSNGQMGRKSKTALRIIVTLEPCYLAFMVFTSSCSSQRILTSSSLAFSNPSVMDSYAAADHHHHHQCSLIKYYDNLAAIPTSRRLWRYDNLPNSKSKMQQ